MSLFLISFFAGMLSVLAPCVLPVLPVILGGSLTTTRIYRPLIIVLSTAVCIVLFTVVLKVSTALIGVPQAVWTTISATIIILYGVTLVIPTVRERVASALGFHKVTSLVDRAKMHEGIGGDVLLGASLGPIFASCSPTYALLLSVIFPNSIIQGVFYTLIYALGFAILLLVFAYGGRAIIKKFARASNPTGTFKKILGRVLIVTGLLILTGYMKRLEIAVLDAGLFDVGKIEQRLLTTSSMLSPSKMGPRQVGEGDTESANESYADAPGKKLLNANYPAPDIVGLDNWINGGNYNSLSELKGKVVLLDFWTYSCINCIRTLESLKSWHAKYADKGLVIVGIHAPEFQFEKDKNNVRKAVEEYGLQYPIVQDNDFQTRKNYDNHYRPAKYIIDREGKVRYTHFGEGEYEQTEQVIQYLLGDKPTALMPEKMADYKPNQTRETYVGSLRAEPSMIAQGGGTIDIGQWRVQGMREQNPEYQLLQSHTGSLFMKFYASEINLVMGNNHAVSTAEIYIDGTLVNNIIIEENKLYNLWKGEGYGLHTIQIRFIGKGVEAYAFTFG